MKMSYTDTQRIEYLIKTLREQPDGVLFFHFERGLGYSVDGNDPDDPIMPVEYGFSRDSLRDAIDTAIRLNK